MRGSLLHWIAILIAAIPGLILVADFTANGLGANPIEEITHTTGDWALRWVLVSLAVTPARRFLGWSRIAPLRRTFGLAGFAYACLHVSTWAVLDLGLDVAEIFEDLTERPYIMAGMAAFTLLLVLAITSTRASMKRFGRRWIRIHQTVYAAATIAVVHHFWLTKADYRPAIVHASVLALLFGARLLWQVKQNA